MQIYQLFSQKNTPKIKHGFEITTKKYFDKLFQISNKK